MSGVERQKVVWKIVVGAVILAGTAIRHIVAPPFGTEGQLYGYYLRTTIIWWVGVYFLATGIRGR